MSDSKGQSQPDDSPATRAIELEIEIAAPVTVVWNALTSAEQLASWFPKDARGSAQDGGTVTFSWDEGVEWTTNVHVIEPMQHLRWVDPAGPEKDSPSTPVPDVAVDFHLEGRGGNTLLRLVHSGFSATAEWDEFFDAMQMGWTYFLFNLDHYLVRHPNTRREMVWVRRSCSEPKQDVWDRLVGPQGLNMDHPPEPTTPRKRYRCRVGGGDAWEGQLRIVNPPMQLAGTVESLHDSLLFVEFELGAPGSPEWNLGVWLSTYGLPGDRVQALQAQLTRTVDHVLGTADPVVAT